MLLYRKAAVYPNAQVPGVEGRRNERRNRVLIRVAERRDINMAGQRVCII